MIKKSEEQKEEKKKLLEEIERKKEERKRLELIKKEKEKIKIRKQLEEFKKQKEQERIEKEIEREKRKKLRKELDIKNKLKQEKIKLKILQMSEEKKRKKLEIKEEIQLKRQRSEDFKKMKEKEEEDKINEYIDELKKKAEKEKELELKEEEIIDEESKHKFRLELLNDYIKQYLEIYKMNDKIKIFEIINKIGKIFKKEINYDKKYFKDNFIYAVDAAESDDFLLKFLGTLGEEYRKHNVYSIIDKKLEDFNLIEGIFKVLLSVYSILPKYEIEISSEEQKEGFIKEPKDFINFIDDLKKQICYKFNILESKVYIISQRIDLCQFCFVIEDKPITNLKKYEKHFHIIAREDSLLEYIKLFPDFFENKFNRDINDWEKKNLIRGGEKYIPPYGWKGYALKVLNKFDDGDNSWLGNEGKEGEWAVAYHGIGKGNEFQKLISIILNNLKAGQCQLYSNIEDKRDKNHNLVGTGVYLSPDINEAEKYSDTIRLGQRKSYFQFIIMCRVKPDKIRQPKGLPLNWVLEDNYDCIRPYRILVKES